MYFSIPDTSEISAKRSSSQHAYTLFNIHINGIHFCSLRYSQFRTFHNDLQCLLPNLMINIQPFPPKKLFTLSFRETDERRLLLERYIQSIVQHKSLISSSYFNNFFLNTQRETLLNESIEKTFPKTISLTIYFLNQHELIIDNLSPYDNTTKVLDTCLNKIQLDNEYTSYFSLFLYEQKTQRLNLIRPLFAFESPYLSLKQTKKMNANSCIVFKKSYWDLTIDLKFLDHRRSCKLLFIQCQYDIEQSQDFYPSDICQQLDEYLNHHSFKEYIQLSRTSKFYGYLILKECSIQDLITQKLSRCLLAIGNYELICYFYSDDQEKEKFFYKNISFKVTRIRCWKVNWTKDDLNIALEYLIKKDTLQWITIHTEQAALVSTCLQEMIDEILAKNVETTSVVSNNRTNGLTTRTQSDLDRFNNNKLFDEGDGDDDL